MNLKWNFIEPDPHLGIVSNLISNIKPFKRQPHKMVRHTQKMFNRFVGFALKGLNYCDYEPKINKIYKIL